MERFKKNFNLDLADPACFRRSEWAQVKEGDRDWNKPRKGYIIYRSMFFAYFLATTIFNMYRFDMKFYFLFLTNWMYFLQLIYSLVYLLRLIWIWVEWPKTEAEIPEATPDDKPNIIGGPNDDQTPHLPWPEKIIWVILSIVSSIPYSVSIGFFLLLYKSSPLPKDTFTVTEYIGSFLVHGTNSPMALLDSTVIAIPIQLSHIVFPCGFLLIYTLYAGLYDVFKGPYPEDRGYIYPFLKWKEAPGIAAASIISGLLSICLMHVIFGWGLYHLRTLIKGKIEDRRKARNNRETEPLEFEVDENNPSPSNSTLASTDESNVTVNTSEVVNNVPT